MLRARSFREGSYSGGRDRMPDCGVVLVEPVRKPDVLDVRMLVASAVDAYCERFELCGPVARAQVLGAIAREAREMRAEL